MRTGQERVPLPAMPVAAEEPAAQTAAPAEEIIDVAEAELPA